MMVQNKPADQASFCVIELALCLALSLIFLLVSGATATVAQSVHPDESVPLYEVFIGADPTEPVLFRLHVPGGNDGGPFYFPGQAGPGPRQEGLVAVFAFSAIGEPLPLERTAGGYFVGSNRLPFYIEYELHLHPSTLKPATWPNNHPYSLRWDDYAYIGGDAFMRSAAFDDDTAEIVFHLPESWTIYTAEWGQIEQPGRLRTNDLPSLALVLGPNLTARQDEGVRLLRIGSLPWPDEDVLSSLSAMMAPLRRRGLVDSAAYDFIIARYPGALRLNPLIAGRAVGRHTFLHWVGVGSHAWWLRHTAADIVQFAMTETINLAPEAGWFRAGGADYVGLLILYEAGLLDVHGVYQNLRTMFATASRYAGAAWPSLLRAGLAERDSHDAQRVLQFRSPIVSFLFDLELRERSGGTVTLLDWWVELAAYHPRTLHNDDLLPPFQTFGDMSNFFTERVFSADRLAVDFEGAFERWVSTLPVAGDS